MFCRLTVLYAILVLCKTYINCFNIVPSEVCDSFETKLFPASSAIYNTLKYQSCTDPNVICNEQEYFNYHEEVKKCQQCFGGQPLINKLSGSLNYGSFFTGFYKSAQSDTLSNEFYKNTLKVNTTNMPEDSWNTNIPMSAAEFNFDQSEYKPGVNYAVLLTKFARKKFVLLDADKYYKQNCTPYGADYVDSICVTHTICQRYTRFGCLQIIFELTDCEFDETYGCHRYGYAKHFQRDNWNGFKCSPIKGGFYKAMKCPGSACSACKFLSWSEWSPCSATRCGINGTMTRTRENSSVQCENISQHKMVEEHRQCNLNGCDELQRDPELRIWQP